MSGKYTHDDLVKKIKSPGWRLSGAADHGTLEEMLKASHQRKTGQKAASLIQEAETAIELDMIQIENLWHYLGLPVA